MSGTTAGKLVIVPGCGLCNRIQAVVCGHLFAADTGRELFVNWPVEPTSCGATMEDLFLPTVPRLDPWPEEVSVYSSIKRYPKIFGIYANQLGSQPHRWFRRARTDPGTTIAVFTCHQFLGYFHDARFAPQVRAMLGRVRPELMQRAEDFRQRFFTERTIGVHVRRQDWRRQRTLDFYFNEMAKFPGATFLISSDDERTFEQVRARFAQSVRFPTSSLVRGERRTIEDALIEVLLLSRTSYLIGTPGSSFSAIPQVAGGMPCNFKYALSLSVRDLQLGNLANPVSILRRRLQQHLRPIVQKMPAARQRDA